MILFKQETKYIRRVANSIYVPVLFFFIAFAFFYYLFSRASILAFVVIISAFFLIAVWDVYRGFKFSVYWMELLEVEARTNTVCIKLFKKDQLILEKQTVIQNLKFVMVPIPGNPTTTYKAEIYMEGTLVGTIYQVCKMDKNKMKEIVLFFNPDDKIANKNRL